jgi:hypothetical protein
VRRRERFEEVCFFVWFMSDILRSAQDKFLSDPLKSEERAESFDSAQDKQAGGRVGDLTFRGPAGPLPLTFSQGLPSGGPLQKAVQTRARMAR